MPVLDILVSAPPDPVIQSAVRILTRELDERFGVKAVAVPSPSDGAMSLVLTLADDLPPEAYRLVNVSSAEFRIEGGDPRGMLYG